MAKRGAQVGDEYAASERGYDGDNETSSSDSSDDGNQEPMWKRGDVGDDLRASEMEGVMLYRGDTGITEDLENPSTPSHFRMVPNEISITALLEGAARFVLVSSKALPYDLIIAFAHFGDMHVVELKRENRYNLTGYVPASLAPGKVEVRVTSPAGDYLGETWFECLDETLDTLMRLEDNADLQRLFFTLWTQHNGFLSEDAVSGYDGDNETSSSDSSENGKREPMWKRGDVGDDLRASEMEGVMLYSGISSITQDLENPSTPSYFRMVPNEISITALLEGAVRFVLVFSKALPYNLNVAFAHFGDMHVVELKRENRYNLTGYVPASLEPGKVEVRVTSPAGDYLGETWFECLDETLDTLKRLEDDADLQMLFLTFWTQHNGSLPEDAVSENGYDGDNEASSSDSSDDGNQLSAA